jgi:pyroglutamyl-peptidase
VPLKPLCDIHESGLNRIFDYITTLSMPINSVRTLKTKPSTLPRVLVTGFEAFGDDPSGQGLNPSAVAARTLHGKRIAGHRVVAAVLPCVYGRSIDTLKTLVKQHQPVLIVCIGQAGGRAGISIERVAINLDDETLPDKAGCVRLNCAVLPDTPTAYFSSLPIQAMLATLQQQGVPCELSSSAGHFVCNHVFYALMHLLATQRSMRNVRGGFIHVPYLPEQANAMGTPCMAQSEINLALSIALRAALVNRTDTTMPITS